MFDYLLLHRNLARHGPLVLLSLVGCRSSEFQTSASGQSRGAATLVQVDSILLAENDTLLLGRVGQGFDVDKEGNLYVAAPSFGRIVRFSPAGQPEMVYGRYGSGPGEFRHVFPVVTVSDSLVYGSASFGRRVNAFRRADGMPLATIRYAGFVTALAETGGLLYFGNFSRRDSAAVGVTPVESILAPANELRMPLQPRMLHLPNEYFEYSELEVSSDVRVAVRGDDIFAAFAPLDWIARWRRGSTILDTIRVPSRFRKGFRREALSQFFVKPRYRFDQAVEAISLLEGIWVLSDDRVALIHMDTEVDMRAETVVSISAIPYLTLLSADLESACPDSRIMVHRESRPVVTIEGDDVYVLEQIVIDGSEPAAATIVRRHRIDDSSCRWIPLDQ